MNKPHQSPFTKRPITLPLIYNIAFGYLIVCLYTISLLAWIKKIYYNTEHNIQS